jgi:phasin family protein
MENTMAKTSATSPRTLPFPMLDGDQFLAAQQRNVDAMTSASQIVVDGAKAFAQRQSEIMQSSVDQWVATGQQVWGGKPGEFKPADQIAQVKAAYETALGNSRELAEIAMKAQNEAFAVLTRAMMANFDDLKSLAKAA